MALEQLETTWPALNVDGDPVYELTRVALESRWFTFSTSLSRLGKLGDFPRVILICSATAGHKEDCRVLYRR